MYWQILPERNAVDWLPLMRELADWLELLPESIPQDLLGGLSFDRALVASVLYVIGFLLLGQFARRGLRDLRARLLHLEARLESSLREQRAPLTGHCGTRREGAATASRPDSLLPPACEQAREQTVLGRRPVKATDQPMVLAAAKPPAASKKQKVAEMAEQGAGRLLIADRLHLRPAEVDLLLRIHLLEQSGGHDRTA